MVERKKRNPARVIRIWSAASSSGEEAYTTAICLSEVLGADLPRWRITIIGTDISERVLERARRGIYGDYAVSKMSEAERRRWFDRTEDGQYRIKPSLRKMVQFQFHNLRDPFPQGSFDLIFLRNVLMYFDTPMKQRVLRNVQDALAPGGYLVVGDVDPIRHTKELREVMTLETCKANLYRKPETEAVGVEKG